MALSLDHSIDIIPFSNSGSNAQTPLRKDNSTLQHGAEEGCKRGVPEGEPEGAQLS